MFYCVINGYIFFNCLKIVFNVELTQMIFLKLFVAIMLLSDFHCYDFRNADILLMVQPSFQSYNKACKYFQMDINIWCKILGINVFPVSISITYHNLQFLDAISFKMHLIYIFLSAKNLRSSIRTQPLILSPSILHLISRITLLCQIGKWMVQQYNAKIVANFCGTMYK